MEMLAKAGVTHLSASEADLSCSLAVEGLWLPYRTVLGQVVLDSGKPYGRLRLDRPHDAKKYHQRCGTSVHAYLPPGLDRIGPGGELFVIEGEFKAMSLMEAGFPAVGISGFFGFAVKGGEKLVPELAEVIKRLKPSRVLLCGDSDTALNYQFAVAAVRAARLLHPLPVVLPRIPLNGAGKGADDCREALGAGFAGWWQERVTEAVSVTSATEPTALALELFQREAGALAGLRNGQAMKTHQCVVKLAAGLESDPLRQEQVFQFVEQNMGLSRPTLRKAVKVALKEQRRRPEVLEETGAAGHEVSLTDPAAIWTRQVWEAVGSGVYHHAGNLCRLHEGRLLPQTAAELVSFLDKPERCQFVGVTKDGETCRASFREADARVFLGSWLESVDLVRTVEVFSNVPVLAWNGKEGVLVTDYSRQMRILAGGGKFTLPDPKAAAECLGELLRDYDFVSSGDAGRAVAMLLSPALAQGGFLGSGRVPLFLIEKNESSSGGSLLLRVLCRIYGMQAKPITRLNNPDRAMEDISKALLSGAGLIYLDNVRGQGLKHLPEFESLLTEPKFSCRAPYLHGEADVTRRVFAVSSNGAVFSRDLSTRTVKVTIRKRPADYAYHAWPEGSLEDHVETNRARYLGAVFSLVDDWTKAGRPAGQQLSGFRFGQWERACAWILERHFPGLPLLDAAHQDDQARLADPDHDLLRGLFRIVVQGETRGELTATSLAEIGAEAGLLDDTEERNRLRIGRAMTRRFPTDGAYGFDTGQFTVNRTTRKSNQGNGHDVKFYEIRTEGGAS